MLPSFGTVWTRDVWGHDIVSVNCASSAELSKFMIVPFVVYISVN